MLNICTILAVWANSHFFCVFLSVNDCKVDKNDYLCIGLLDSPQYIYNVKVNYD